MAHPKTRKPESGPFFREENRVWGKIGDLSAFVWVWLKNELRAIDQAKSLI